MDAREGSRPLLTPQEEASRRTRRKRAQRKRQADRLQSRISQLESENHRLRLIASTALGLCQAGDAENAAETLKQIITVDSIRYVPRDEAGGEAPPVHFVGRPWRLPGH